MFGLPAWLLVIPVLGFLIFVHELGHFLTAKWFNIKVTEFGFGFRDQARFQQLAPSGCILAGAK